MPKHVITDTKDINDAFEAIGFGSIELNGSFKQDYAGYKWYLIPHWRVTNVVYAVPSNDDIETKPWESWYLDGGAETHHVHYAYKIHDDDIKWIQKEWTEERPDEIIGRYWYWYDDKDMKPVLLQKD